MNGKNTTWQDPHARRLLAAAVAFAALLGIAGALGGAAAGWAAHRGQPCARWPRQLPCCWQMVSPPARRPPRCKTQPNSPGWQLVAQMGRDTPAAWGPGALAGMLAGSLAALALGLLAVGGVVLWLHGQGSPLAASARHRAPLRGWRRRGPLALGRRGHPGASCCGRWTALPPRCAPGPSGSASRNSFCRRLCRISPTSSKPRSPRWRSTARFCRPTPPTPRAVRRCAAKTAAATERMTRLVRTLLKLAQVDAGGVPFAPALCPLDALAADASRTADRPRGGRGQGAQPGRPRRCRTLRPGLDGRSNRQPHQKTRSLPHGAGRAHRGAVGARGRSAAGSRCRTTAPGIPPQDLPHLFKALLPRQRAGGARGSALACRSRKPCSKRRGGALSVESEPRRGRCVPRKSARPFKIVRESSPRCKLNLVG